METFRDYAYYYNIFYKDKDYRIEALEIDILLRRYGRDIHRILNFGCGTGRHDIEFAKLGYQCQGVDASPLMVELAKESAANAGMDINFSVEDIRGFEPREKYDAVISLFHVMSYQKRNQDVLAAFGSARKALDKGGVFLFDVWYGPGVLSDKPVVRVKEMEDKTDRFIRIARPVMHDKENVVDVCYEIFIINQKNGQTKVINEVHNMRYFFRPELELMLNEAGFALIDNLDCQTLEETGYHTWTSYFIAKAV